MAPWHGNEFHYTDVIMGKMVSQITSLTIVYSTVYPGPDQRKHQSSASLAFVRGIHRGQVNSPHKWSVTRKMFPFYDVIMLYYLSFVSGAHWSPEHWRFIFYQVKQDVEQIFGLPLIWDATTLMRHYCNMRQWAWSTLVKVIACCLTTPNHLVLPCWYFVMEILTNKTQFIFYYRQTSNTRRTKPLNWNFSRLVV